MNILIFGQNGQVARALKDCFQEDSQFNVTILGSQQCDLMVTTNIDKAISEHAPDWVINASAYTAVDQAESDQQACYQLNQNAPVRMAELCKQNNVPFIHYSTDYVFSGNADTPYKESDETAPNTVYGKSKRAGEEAILGLGGNSWVIRTSWVYDKEGKNFVNTMLRFAAERSEMNVVNDQLGSPTYAPDLAEITYKMLLSVSDDGHAFLPGIYHVTGQGQTSWYDFCREIYAIKGLKTSVNPITTDAFPTPAKRPAYSVLDNSKLKANFGLVMPKWCDALHRCLSV